MRIFDKSDTQHLVFYQGHLQMLFDWQAELDKLNVHAQMLLETCSDTRISNGITQITTKYNALLSLAKEVMKRLELHYQVRVRLSVSYIELLVDLSPYSWFTTPWL